MGLVFVAGGGPPTHPGLCPGELPHHPPAPGPAAPGACPTPAPDDDDSPVPAHITAIFGERWQQARPAWTQGSWWEAPLRDDVRGLLWLSAGPVLLGALAALAPAYPCPLPHDHDRIVGQPTPGHGPGWPCACQVIIAAAWEACAAWVAAGAARALVDAAGPTPVQHAIDRGRVIEEPAREELAVALRSSPAAMQGRIGAARSITAHPPLLALVESAAITAWAGRLVTDHLVGLDQAQAERVVAEVAARVHARLASGRRPWHSGEVNRQARAARLRICPEQEQAARVRAFAHRRVVVHPGSEGMATLIAELAEVDARRIHRRLTGIAEALEQAARADGGTEPRTRDQLRADAFVDVVLAAAPQAGATEPPRPAGSGTVGSDASEGDAAGTAVPRPEINVVLPWTVLLGLADDPAEVPGLGPIPADLARELAADGTWRAWVADANGAITATGSRGYVPSEAVARAVRAREPHCRFPGCRQPASRCDLDHAIPWPRGSTKVENLGPLCRRHHNLKTHLGWGLDPGLLPDPDHDHEQAHPRDPGRAHARDAGRAHARDPEHPPAPDIEPAPAVPGWSWRSPAGLVITDGPPPPF
jgi:hypothetical protein